MDRQCRCHPQNRTEADILRARIAELEAASAKDREWVGRAIDKQKEYLEQCQVLIAERDAAKAEAEKYRAGEARAVEALRKIAEGAQTDIQALCGLPLTVTMLCGLCGQINGHNQGCPALAFGELNTQPALDWLAQVKREAAAEELRNMASLFNTSGVIEVLKQMLLDRSSELEAG
jgi:hypothetical protein